MPETADIVIIGGGVMGCGLAYWLAKQGLKPVVIEKSDIGGEASGSNGGGVRQSARHAKEMPFAMASVKMFETLHEELGMSVEYTQKGNLRLCVTDAEVNTLKKAVENQKAMGLDLDFLDRKQILDINPYVGEKIIGATWCPTDGHANPFLVTYAFFKNAKERGATFYTQERVTDILFRKGRVRGVVTDKRVIETDTVVNAAGVAGRDIANLVGLDLPLRPIFTEALITEPYPKLFSQMVGQAGGLFYGRQTSHGSFFWGGFAGLEQFVHRGGKPLFHFIGPVIARMVNDYFPVLKDLHAIRMWSGLIEGISDGLPVLGLVEEVPGFVFMTGFSGHGFGISPIITKLMSELILDCKPSTPLGDFCYTRFNTSGETDCACGGGDACAIHSTLCPNKREFLKNL